MMTLLDIETALTEQGHFCLLDWLILQNHILYSDYERWRNGELKSLDAQIKLSSDKLAKINDSIASHSEKLLLKPQEHINYSWSSQPQLIDISQDKVLDRQLSQHWVRPQDVPQMDLFMDNAAVIAENTLISALESRHFDQAQMHLDQLTQLNATHHKIGHYQDLIHYGHHMQGQTIGKDAIEAELAGLEQEVIPLAKTTLRKAARDYLAFAWRRLAKGMTDKPFDHSQEKLHASYALMQVPDWQAALSCLLKEEGVYQQVTLVLRVIQCLEALKKPQQALVHWCLLMELDESACEESIEAKASPLIEDLWEAFWEISDDLPAAFFPAYLLLQQPGLIHHLQEIPPLTLPATQTVVAAIQARINKEDEVPYRKRLQEINPLLLKLFIAA